MGSKQSAVGQGLTSWFAQLAPGPFAGDDTPLPDPAVLKSETGMNSTQPGELKTWKHALESEMFTDFPPTHPRNLSGTMYLCIYKLELFQ